MLYTGFKLVDVGVTTLELTMRFVAELMAEAIGRVKTEATCDGGLLMIMGVPAPFLDYNYMISASN